MSENWLILIAFLWGLSALLCIGALIAKAIERRQAKRYKSPLFIYEV